MYDLRYEKNILLGAKKHLKVYLSSIFLQKINR